LKNDKPIDILSYIKINILGYIKRINSFSYAYITYRIMLTICFS